VKRTAPATDPFAVGQSIGVTPAALELGLPVRRSCKRSSVGGHAAFSQRAQSAERRVRQRSIALHHLNVEAHMPAVDITPKKDRGRGECPRPPELGRAMAGGRYGARRLLGVSPRTRAARRLRSSSGISILESPGSQTRV